MPVDWCKEGWLLTAGRALQAEGGKGGMEAESGEIYICIIKGFITCSEQRHSPLKHDDLKI